MKASGFLAPDVLLGPVPLFMGVSGGRRTEKRVEAARFGNAAAVLHNLRIVDTRGAQ
jgi:hypothetical protein